MGASSVPGVGHGLNVSVGCYDGTVVGMRLGAEDDALLAMEALFAYTAHAGAVRSLALRGNTLASGSSDETVRVYDVRRRLEVAALVHHSGSVNALSFAHDPLSSADFLFSASDDASIGVTRTSDWRLVKQLTGHTAPVLDIAVHPSARVALSVAKDRSLFMWNLVKGKVAFSAKTKPGPATSIQWSPSGSSYMLIAETSVALYNGEGQLDANLIHKAPVMAADFLDENLVVTGGEEKIVNVWDIRSGKVCATAATHDARVRAVAASSGLVLSADSAGGLKVWDHARGGTPRLETSIGGGAMRLTRMTMGPVSALDAISKKRERKNTDFDTGNSAGDSEDDADRHVLVDNTGVSNEELEPLLSEKIGKWRGRKSKSKNAPPIEKPGTASSRKRQKRKNSQNK